MTTVITDVKQLLIKNAKNGDFELNLATGGGADDESISKLEVSTYFDDATSEYKFEIENYTAGTKEGLLELVSTDEYDFETDNILKVYDAKGKSNGNVIDGKILEVLNGGLNSENNGYYLINTDGNGNITGLTKLSAYCIPTYSNMTINANQHKYGIGPNPTPSYYLMDTSGVYYTSWRFVIPPKATHGYESGVVLFETYATYTLTNVTTSNKTISAQHEFPIDIFIF